MLLIMVYLVAFLLDLPTVKADTRYCGHASELATTRLRSEAAHQTRIEPELREESCREYRMQFYQAVTARQAASTCSDGIDHQRDLDLFDAEIAAFNDVIASLCGL